jgi:hypothetical protein
MDRRWFWLVVPLLGVTEYAAHAYLSRRAPAPEAYSVLTEKLKALHHEGDLVVMTPRWAEPNLRRVVGDALMPLSVIARPDETAFERALEVSILGARSQLPSFSVASSERVGPFTVSVLYNTKHEPVLTDFVSLIGTEHASVFTRRDSVTGGDEWMSCHWVTGARVTNGALAGHPTFPAARYECGGAESHFVGVTVIDDHNYLPKRCIWASPDGRSETVVRFSDVRLGKKIRGFAGLSYLYERESKGPPIHIDIYVDASHVGEYTHLDGEGWTPFEVSTESFSNTSHQVEFRVVARRTSPRDLCFQADVR